MAVSSEKKKGHGSCRSLLGKVYYGCSALVLIGFCNSSTAGEIHDAAKNGELSKVQALVVANPNMVKAKEEKSGGTPLHFAAVAGNTEVADYLLSNGADVNAVSDSGVTPLHSACYGGFVATVKLLLARGADVSAKASTGATPLDLAKAKGNSEVIQLFPALTLGSKTLLQGKSQTEENTDPKYIQGFFNAVASTNTITAEYFLSKGLSINVRGGGRTALGEAVRSRNLRSVKWLIARGADVNADVNSNEQDRDEAGITPLHAAASLPLANLSGQREIAEQMAMKKQSEAWALDYDSRGRPIAGDPRRNL